MNCTRDGASENHDAPTLNKSVPPSILNHTTPPRSAHILDCSEFGVKQAIFHFDTVSDFKIQDSRESRFFIRHITIIQNITSSEM